MHPIRRYFKCHFICLLLLASTVSSSETSLRVVTSFSILEDLVKQLGGEYVQVVNLVARNNDAHMYQPKPSDAVAIAGADLVVFNGLAFEGWIERLIKNSGYKNQQLIASNGVAAIKNGAELDPHAWQSFQNIRVYIQNITHSLIGLRPQHTEKFTQLKKQYLHRLSDLEHRLKKELASIPRGRRVVVTSHDAFAYLGREFDIRFVAPVGISIEVEASAEDVAGVIDQIREKNVKALFVENINNPRLLEQIAAETRVAIGGRLYSDALSEIGGPADTYLNMMQYNIEALLAAF
ncbi:MAG: zinc ABC transporter substrate-binding protein [Cellvibrionaceae bacterium]|nr:zinc ABC transporter substrate-binding protein [Cellvibrionaceae bacterium]